MIRGTFDSRLSHTNRAKRTHTLMLDHWNRHRPVDQKPRRKLGLPME
jgi:hypothetical protein